MNELLHIKNKISLRIKSMPETEAGRYAKRMMRRCIKDIDKVIEANETTRQINNIDKLNINTDSIREIKEAWKRSGIEYDSEFSESIAKKITERYKDNKRQHKFNMVKQLVDDGVISYQTFISLVLRGSYEPANTQDKKQRLHA